MRFFNEFNLALDPYVGLSGNALSTLFKKGPESAAALFFEPYKSRADILTRSLDVVTAPISFTLLALSSLAESIVNLVIGVYQWGSGDKDRSESFKTARLAAVFSLILVMPAVLSPLINLIEALGAGVNSIAKPTTNEKPEPCAHASGMQI